MKKTLENVTKINQKNNTEIKSSVNKKIIKYIFSPFLAGLYGFAAFFTIVILTEFFAFHLGNNEHFSVDMDDIMLSSLGFICFFLISLIKNYNKE